MILPIVAFGDPVLKQEAKDITQDYPDLDKLIDNMYDTMYNASGVGLAAPQVGLPIRLFIVDTVQLEDPEETPDFKGIKHAFINATILTETGKPWPYEEGCLSIPGIRENVHRQPHIEIEYLDENFQYQRSTFDGMNARVIQHEYDHVDGILFLDHLKPLKKRLLKRKLQMISRGDVNVGYKMKFPLVKGR